MDDVPWIDRLELFRWPLIAALVAALVGPAVGAFLYVRRTSFHGIVLPQFAAAGVVFSYAILAWWIETIGLGGLTVDEALHDPHAASSFGLAWGAAFTVAGLVLLVWTGRRGGPEAARAAAAFAVASALVLVFGRLSPIGRGQVDQLLQGESLGVGVHDLEVLVVALGAAAVCLAWFGRDLVLTSYDRETAIVLGKNATALEALFHGIVALVVAAGTLILGPILIFGLLVVPPLAARPWARSMTAFVALSVAIGAVSAIAGEAASLEWDLPLGPAIVVASALFLVPARLSRSRT